MHGWSGHTYKWVKADGTWHYVKIKVISQQGIDNFSADEAKVCWKYKYFPNSLYQSFRQWRQIIQITIHKNSGRSSLLREIENLLIKFRERIAAGNFPTWHVAIQTMTPEEGQKYKYDVVCLLFDHRFP
jgi:catalase